MLIKKPHKKHKPKEYHGLTNTRAYTSWIGILRRCYNKDSSIYKSYGKRGIRVCDRWHSMVDFYADMGERPIGLSLERTDNNGHYEFGNCKWGTPEEQSNNKRTNIKITFNGVTKTASQWARHCCLKGGGVILSRLRKGWPLEKVLTVGHVPARKNSLETRQRIRAALLGRPSPKKGTGKMYTFKGRTMSATSWGEELGITRAGFRDRMKFGLPEADVFRKGHLPVGPKKGYKQRKDLWYKAPKDNPDAGTQD